MTLTRLRAALLAALFALAWTPAFAEIKDWSTTPGSNATITDSTYGNIGFAEGQAPSTLNDSARALMAHVRAWYQGGGWTNLGFTHTYASATSVTVASTDVTAHYPAGRRIKAVGSTTGTIYGRVTSSSFSTNTTINVAWDSGSLSSETLAISVGFLNATGSPAPADIAGAFNLAKGAAVASAASPSSTDIWSPAGNLVHVTGTNSMGSFGTAPQAGATRIVVFDGAASLIHSASGIVLPCSTNITTAANDIALVIADTTTKHLVVYFKADGTAPCATAYTPNKQIWTATGTFSKSSVTNGATHIVARCWGGGGGGGGGHTAASSRGTGGGGGSFSEERIALSSLASSEDVTIGAGGPGGAAGSPGAAGTAGGTSSFGTTPFFTAGGGAAGLAGNGGTQAGVAGGTASGGDTNLSGGGSEISFGGAAEAPKGGSAARGGQGGWQNVATAGLAPGGGGSAGNHASGNGGAGADGRCEAEW